MRYFIIYLVLFTNHVHANHSFYFTALGNIAYTTSDTPSLSSLTGSGVGVTGGYRSNYIAFELSAKRFNLDSKPIGSSDYNSKIVDSTFSGGFRLFADNSFSLKAGLIFHQVEMDIFKNSIRQDNHEFEDDIYGLYAGMGIIHQISKSSEIYIESSLYPMPTADIALIDFEFGLRIYLGN